MVDKCKNVEHWWNDNDGDSEVLVIREKPVPVKNRPPQI
jgi:hypothetical protein